MADWIKFVLVDLRDSRKTKVWAVLTIDGRTNLGAVSWYSPWRKYGFSPNPQTVFEQDCLRKIADFCELQTNAHRSKHKAITHLNGDIHDNRIENLKIVNLKENLS